VIRARAGCGLCVAVLCGAPTLGAAADWSVQSSAQLLAQLETNPRLLSEGSTDAQAGVAELSLNLLRRTELLDLAINAHGSIRRYTQDVSLDRDDQQITLQLQRRGERFTLAAVAAGARDTTLTSELGTTGFVQENQRHSSLSGSLSPRWQLTERSTGGASIAWQQSRYEQTQLSPLVNYQYGSVGLNTAHHFSEKGSVSVLADAGRLTSDSYGFNTDNIGLSAQVDYSWSEQWSGAISGGASRVKTDGRNRNGSVYSATLSHQGERMSVDARIARTVAPTGRGLLSRRDEAGINLHAALLENLEGAASFSLMHSRDFVPQFGFSLNNVRYTRAELSLSWRLAQNWSLGFVAGRSEQAQIVSDLVGHGFDARLQLAWRRATPVG
jgi:hypothetical protein